MTLLAGVRTVTTAMALMAFATAPAAAAEPEITAFETPEQAIHGLIEALKQDSLAPLEAILGKGILDRLPPSERAAHERRKSTGLRLAKQRILLQYDDDERTRATILLGQHNFRVPMPLMKAERGWVYDVEAGVKEMIRRQVGSHEDSAIRALRAFAAAQADYVRIDWDDDRLLEFAQRIASTDGSRDGLVWRDPAAGLESSLLNHAFAAAEGNPGDPGLMPSDGYAFKVLTGQGENALGGPISYIVNGNMIIGFGIVAYPIEPGETGEFTFIMNHAGIIYEQDLGPDTHRLVAEMDRFDPGSGWWVVEK